MMTNTKANPENKHKDKHKDKHKHKQKRQTQRQTKKTNTENEPQHILTHEELKAIEENPRDVAQDEDTHDADEDESQVHLDNLKYKINKYNSKRQIEYIRMLFRPPSLQNSSSECERTWKNLQVRKYLYLFVFVFICICLYLLIVLSSPDPPEYLEVEYNEGDDRDDTGAHQSSPVDVEPVQRFQQFFRRNV